MDSKKSCRGATLNPLSSSRQSSSEQMSWDKDLQYILEQNPEFGLHGQA